MLLFIESLYNAYKEMDTSVYCMQRPALAHCLVFGNTTLLAISFSYINIKSEYVSHMFMC